jgi:hypothetical protein
MPLRLACLPSRWFYPEVRNIPIAASAMIPAAAHPTALKYTGRCSFPMTFGLLAISIIKHITGAAVTPLIIAAQTSALMGSNLVKLISNPISVATASTP